MGITGAHRQTGAGRRSIVAFDFDGTLTVRDSYTAFLLWQAGPAGAATGLMRLLPALAAYVIHRDRGALKAAATSVFLKGLPLAELQARSERFAAAKWDAMMRPDALAAWAAHGEAERVIVTASPETVVAPFAARLGADRLIGTRLTFADERVTGGFAGPNCRGPQKVARLEEVYGPGVRLAAAYGDTAGDREMLAIADRPGMKVFTARP